MGNSDIFLESLTKKYGANSEFAELYRKNQEVIKIQKKIDRHSAIGWFIWCVLMLISAFINCGIYLAIIAFFGIIIYEVRNQFQHSKKCQKIFEKETKDAS